MAEPYKCTNCGNLHDIRVYGRNDYGEEGSACPVCKFVYDIPDANRTTAGNLARTFASNPVVIDPTVPLTRANDPNSIPVNDPFRYPANDPNRQYDYETDNRPYNPDNIPAYPFAPTEKVPSTYPQSTDNTRSIPNQYPNQYPDNPSNPSMTRTKTPIR